LYLWKEFGFSSKFLLEQLLNDFVGVFWSI
jgi:hypothetical protein